MGPIACISEEGWCSHEAFFHELNSKPGDNIKSSSEGGDDLQFEKREETEIRLFKYNAWLGPLKTLNSRVVV